VSGDWAATEVGSICSTERKEEEWGVRLFSFAGC